MIITKVKIKLRNLIYDLNALFPNISIPLIEGWNILHQFKFMIKKKTSGLKRISKLNTNKGIFKNVLFVNPQKIQYFTKKKFNEFHNTSKIFKGDWDLKRKNIEKSFLYKAFKQRFKEGKKWEETDYYSYILNQNSHGIKKWDDENKEKLDKRLNEIEILYHQIQNDGYKFNNKMYLQKANTKLGENNNNDNIKVAIDRDGQFLIIDGITSFLITKILEITEIPVIVILRHNEWADFKKTLYYFSTNYRNRKLYQRITHPDLQEIPFKHGENRFNIIKENLSISQGKLLDIGANLGYFCHVFEEEGFDCYAVELNQLYLRFLTKLKKAENKNFKIIPMSIFNYRKDQELKFDVVLALYIFHHFIKRKNTYENLIALLKRLKTKELYFGVHDPNEFRNMKVYRNYNHKQFVEFILKYSCLNKAKLLIKFENGRSIYKLTSND